MDPSGQPSRSAAQRRRERRLRSMLWHERMSVAMALAEKLHHSDPRRPTMARARGEEKDELHNATGHPPSRAAARSTSPWTTTGMCLPPGLTGFMRSGHRTGFCGAPWSRTSTPSRFRLDVPEQQMGNQLVEVLQMIDTRTLHKVIEVPKIFLDRVPQRLVESRPPQMAEQLVEVPTIISFVSLQQQTAEQIVDIPVSGRGGELGGFQGLHRGQSSTAFFEQIAESPVPSGSLHDFQPVQGSAASSSVFPGHASEGFFGLFSVFFFLKKKKSDFRRESECEGARMRSSHHDGAVPRDDLWVQIRPVLLAPTAADGSMEQAAWHSAGLGEVS